MRICQTKASGVVTKLEVYKSMGKPRAKFTSTSKLHSRDNRLVNVVQILDKPIRRLGRPLRQVRSVTKTDSYLRNNILPTMPNEMLSILHCCQAPLLPRIQDSALCTIEPRPPAHYIIYKQSNPKHRGGSGVKRRHHKVTFPDLIL